MATTHIVLLRGINVGRHNRIAMVDLREILTGLGCTQVRTLLNSGNAVVTTEVADPAALARTVSAAIHDTLGLSIRTVVRSRSQVEQIIARNPMAEQALGDPASFHVGFWDTVPAPGAFDVLDGSAFGAERFVVDGDTVYLWFAHGVRGSRLAQALTTHKLDAGITMRNWNTVRKLAALAGP